MIKNFKGQTIVEGEVKGEVLLSPQPLNFNCIDLSTGQVNDKNNKLNGRSVAGKILVISSLLCNVDMWKLYRLGLRENRPLGLICVSFADDYTIVGSTLVNLPLIHLVSPDLLKFLQDRQLVKICKDSVLVC